MTKQLITLGLLLLLSLQSWGQRYSNDQIIHAYPALGFTVSQIEGDELKGFDKWGFSAGVGAMINLGRSEMFKLSVETDFSQRGSFNGTGDRYNLYNFTLNYIDIPVVFHFHDPYGGMVLGLGLNYGRLVQTPHGEIGYNPLTFIPDSNNFNFLKNDFSFVADMQFTVWQGLKLNFRYQQSILPVKKGMKFTTPVQNGEDMVWYNNCFNQSVTVRLLYIFGDDGHKPKPGYYSHHHRSHRSHHRRR